MVDIYSVPTGRSGQRTYIAQGRKMTVIDGSFGSERSTVHTTSYAPGYLYGS